MIAAYCVFWGLTFVLVLTMWAKHRRLDHEIEALRAMLAELEGPGASGTP
jgi:hypothetical protein